MKKTNHRLVSKLLGVSLVFSLVLTALPMAGLSASAQNYKGAYFLSGNPPFAYVITGVKPEQTDNTVKLYQNENMQSYAGYTGIYEIPEKAYDEDEMKYYTVTEIGGAVGDSTPGALQGVPLRGITLPRSLTTIGSQAFANSGLTELSLPTSVTSLSSDAFAGTVLQTLELNVVNEATLQNGISYTTTSRPSPITLPRQVTDLNVTAALTLSGETTLPGHAILSTSKLTLANGASLRLGGTLSGSGTITVSNNATLTLDSASLAAFRGQIRLAGTVSKLENYTSSPVTVVDASGNTAVVKAGDTRTGGQANDPSEGEDDPSGTHPQISVNYGGNVAVEDRGKTVVINAFSGYHVEEVVINGKSMGTITRYEFETASSRNTVAVTFADGKGEEGPDEPGQDPIFSFTDVSPDAWYAEAVSFMVKNKIFFGVSKTKFAPTDETTRAMFVSLLYRLDDYDAKYAVECDTPATLSDIKPNSWYEEAAAWAVGSGIFQVSGDKFYPSRSITREEIASCLFYFTHARGYDTITDASLLDDYRDKDRISPNNREAVAWAVTNGYLTGRSGNLLDPSGDATRVEIAEMLMRYLKIN